MLMATQPLFTKPLARFWGHALGPLSSSCRQRQTEAWRAQRPTQGGTAPEHSTRLLTLSAGQVHVGQVCGCCGCSSQAKVCRPQGLTSLGGSLSPEDRTGRQRSPSWTSLLRTAWHRSPRCAWEGRLRGRGCTLPSSRKEQGRIQGTSSSPGEPGRYVTQTHHREKVRGHV